MNAATDFTTADPALYVVSGAGLSAESGVPTFRSDAGLWGQHNLKRVCNALTWKNNRSEVFEFYAARRRDMGACLPNAGHAQLAIWQRRWGTERVKLLTQNVDDLLERAGAVDVTHLHGTLDKLQCTACGTFFAVDMVDYHEGKRCPQCQSLKGVKPGVVFFYEAAPAYVHLHRLAKTIRSQDVLIVVGTAFEVVTPEAFLPRWRKGHALNWQVNPAPAEPDWFGLNMSMGASHGLQSLDNCLSRCMSDPG